MRKTLVLMFFLLIAGTWAQDKPTNIILCIGDGMGIGQLSSLLLTDSNAALARFPVVGLVKTPSKSSLVTESAASGTALSTGMRTRNGFIAVDSSGNLAETLFERAHSLGKKTGLIVTSSVTDKTPAAFVAHTTSTKDEDEIARQIASSNIDVLIGGGWKHFFPKSLGGVRHDRENLLALMESTRYTIRTNHECPDGEGKKALLVERDALPPAGRRDYSLADLVQCALASLARDDTGFLCVVEGSQIDWACHDNDFPGLLRKMRDFDAAVDAALRFAGEDRRTLVIVTADHETGGLSVSGKDPRGSDIRGSWTGTWHTASLIAMCAFGSGATRFAGVKTHDEIGRILFSLL
ncbi:MAG: alkaline phosphatase [Bacteroidota bacterium]|nr:alkaline phosphatase [Bacteroidota bacterium]